MGVPQARWMFSFMENPMHKWMMTGGTPKETIKISPNHPYLGFSTIKCHKTHPFMGGPRGTQDTGIGLKWPSSHRIPRPKWARTPWVGPTASSPSPRTAPPWLCPSAPAGHRWGTSECSRSAGSFLPTPLGKKNLGKKKHRGFSMKMFQQLFEGRSFLVSKCLSCVIRWYFNIRFSAWLTLLPEPHEIVGNSPHWCMVYDSPLAILGSCTSM